MLIDQLYASFDTGDFVTAVKLVDAITLAAEEIDQHPELDLAYGRLDVRLDQSRRRWGDLARRGAGPDHQRSSPGGPVWVH
jgi:pterin-4a-carbinolamine dehydratase